MVLSFADMNDMSYGFFVRFERLGANQIVAWHGEGTFHLHSFESQEGTTPLRCGLAWGTFDTSKDWYRFIMSWMMRRIKIHVLAGGKT